MSEKWIAGMNSQQAAAVGSPLQGAVLVLAGAGSGKTTVLTRRVAYLMERFPDGGILALTFTKDAAHEMETRLRALLGDSAATSAQPRIGTFHSFALGLIRAVYQGKPNWSRLGFARSPELIEPGAQASARTVEKNPQGNLAWAPDGPAETVKPETAAIAFDDMVALAIRLLTEHPEVLADLHARYPQILVDEFQDTSRDQLDLVKLLTGPSPNLFLVGDDDQAIYGFRGADPRNIGEALDHFPGMRILKLEINYRSSAAIVAYANGVFRNKPVHLRKRLEAGRSLGNAPVRLIAHANGADQGRWIVEEMGRLRREAGLAWSDMAILFRLNALEPYYRSMLAKLAGEDAGREVVLSTVHAAKGLEYPAVFFAGLEDGILPYRRGGEKPEADRLDEERRIFYVGVTRAQRYLYLCSCRLRILRGKTVEAEASPFLRTPSRLQGRALRILGILGARRREKGES